MLKKKLSLAIGAAMLTFGSVAQAADIKFNGFASVSGGVMFNETEDQGSIPYTDKLSFKPESLFAIQANATLSDDLTATVQLMSEGKNDFDVEATWAYMTYKLDETHSIQAGRLVNPLYYMAEYEKVRYAHNTRLPQAVYQPIAFDTIEGVALNSNYNINDMTLSTKLLYGGWDGEAFLSSTGSWEAIKLDNMFGANIELAGDWWKVFAGGHIAEMDFPAFNTGVVAGIAQSILDEGSSGINLFDTQGNITPEYQGFIDTVGWDGKDSYYTYIGFGAEYNNILLNGEFSRAGVKDATDAIDHSWYVSLGYRFDNLVLTYTVEDFSQESYTDYLDDVDNTDLKDAGVTIGQVFGQRAFDGQMVSMRYDLNAQAALKVDYISGSSNTGDFDGLVFGIDMVF